MNTTTNRLDHRATRQRIRLARPRTAEQLHAYVHRVLGFWMPQRALNPGHSAPFEYLQHSFFEDQHADQRDCIVWANRGGGKTQIAAIATLLDLVFKPGIQIRILGGSFDQSAKMYRYLKRMLLESELFDDMIAGHFTGRHVELTNGSRVEVLSQSECAVRGQRVHKLRCDEVELFDRDIWEAAQMVTRSGHCGDVYVRAAIETLSTMHKPHGLMHELVTTADVQRRRVFRWSVMDVLQHCGRERRCGVEQNAAAGPDLKSKGMRNHTAPILGGANDEGNQPKLPPTGIGPHGDDPPGHHSISTTCKPSISAARHQPIATSLDHSFANSLDHAIATSIDQTVATSLLHPVHAIAASPQYSMTPSPVGSSAPAMAAVCPLWDECRGRAKSTAVRGFLRIDDAIQQKRRVGHHTWAAEMLCDRPSRTHCVYPEFDMNRHVFDRDGDWKAAPNAPPQSASPLAPPVRPALSAPSLLSVPESRRRTGKRIKGNFYQGLNHGHESGSAVGVVGGMDFGFREAVLLWAVIDAQGVVDIVDELIERECPVDRFVQLAMQRGATNGFGAPQWVGADPAGHQRSDQTGISTIAAWRKLGWRIRTRRTSIQAGIHLVRARLLRADGSTGLRIHGRCEQLIRAMNEYHYPDDKPDGETPVKDGPDHACDALRYLIANVDGGAGELKSRNYLRS